MAEDKQEKQGKGGLDAPEQPEDVRKANLLGVAPSTGTASGLAAAEAKGIDVRPKPENEGSTVKIAGGDPKPDAEGPTEPVGAQKQPATFVSNGSVPANVGASNYGFVPVGILADDPEEANRIAKEQVETAARPSNLADDDGPPRVTREQIDRASAAELRAAATDRGLDLGALRGSRGTRAAFIEAQNKKYGEGGEEKGGSRKAGSTDERAGRTPPTGGGAAPTPASPGSPGAAATAANIPPGGSGVGKPAS